MDRIAQMAWALKEADRLETLASGSEVQRRMAMPIQAKPLAASGLDFLRKHARGSFYETAVSAFDVRVNDPGAGLRLTADVLRRWTEYVESGMAAEQPIEVQARIDASTDLMEQVQTLLRDHHMHPAAPVVLAGAALEEFLRGMCEAAGCVPERRNITNYVQALKAEGTCSAQDVKDVTSWAGQRNEAAHGNFDNLSIGRAQIMVDGINFFIRQHSSN